MEDLSKIKTSDLTEAQKRDLREAMIQNAAAGTLSNLNAKLPAGGMVPIDILEDTAKSAARAGSLSAIQWLANFKNPSSFSYWTRFQDPANLNSQSVQGNVLHELLHNNDISLPNTQECLLAFMGKWNVSPNASILSNGNLRPLTLALMRVDLPLSKKILAHGASIQGYDPQASSETLSIKPTNTPLRAAIDSGDMALLDWVLDREPGVKESLEPGSPIAYAIELAKERSFSPVRIEMLKRIGPLFSWEGKPVRAQLLEAQGNASRSANDLFLSACAQAFAFDRPPALASLTSRWAQRIAPKGRWEGPLRDQAPELFAQAISARWASGEQGASEAASALALSLSLSQTRFWDKGASAQLSASERASPGHWACFKAGLAALPPEAAQRALPDFSKLNLCALASALGSLEALDIILAKSPNSHAPDPLWEGASALTCALLSGNKAGANLLMDRGADPLDGFGARAVKPAREYPIFAALSRQEPEAFERLLTQAPECARLQSKSGETLAEIARAQLAKNKETLAGTPAHSPRRELLSQRVHFFTRASSLIERAMIDSFDEPQPSGADQATRSRAPSL